MIGPMWDNWRAGCVSGVFLTLLAEGVLCIGYALWKTYLKD